MYISRRTVQALATLATRTTAFKTRSVYATCRIPCQRRQHWSSNTSRASFCTSPITAIFRRPCGSPSFAILCVASQSYTTSILSTQVSAVLANHWAFLDRSIDTIGVQNIKPDNIMTDFQDGRSPVVKLTDLEDSVHLPPPYSMMGRRDGNSRWRSPESHCQGLVNTPSNVFSFGATVRNIFSQNYSAPYLF